MDKIDLILDAVHQTREGINRVEHRLESQCSKCDARFSKLERTLFGNGLPGLKAKVYLLLILVAILFSYHGIDLTGIFK